MLSGCPRYFGNLLPSFSRASRYYKNSIQLFRVFPFSDNGKKAKYLPLAPIEVEIPRFWGGDCSEKRDNVAQKA
jgi:hypothetical protein